MYFLKLSNFMVWRMKEKLDVWFEKFVVFLRSLKNVFLKN